MAAGAAGPPTTRARPTRRDACLEQRNGRFSSMTRHHEAVVAALAAVLALAAPASAQQPADQRRVDSLAAEVRALKARLDSGRGQLARPPAGPRPAGDTSRARA